MSRAKSPASMRKSVGVGTPTRKSDSTPSELLGIGPVSMHVLKRAGIATRADLERLGPVRAYIAAKRIEPGCRTLSRGDLKQIFEAHA
jgi:hypothetical protein